MEKGIDIRNYDKLLTSTVRRMRASNISKKSKALMEKFNDFCFASGIGKARVIKYKQTLKQLALWLLRYSYRYKGADIIEKFVVIEPGMS